MSATRILVEDPSASPAPNAGVGKDGCRARGDGGHAEGSLVCVIATSGGAGATTAALLLGWQATSDGCRVLCGDAAGPASDLARLAGGRSTRSLLDSAALLERGRLEPDGLFATAAGGLRVIASQGYLNCGAEGVGRLLSLARQAHDLVIVDAGTLAGPAAIAAYEQASHLVWVLAATPEGGRRAQRTLAAVGRHPTARELIAARGCKKALGRVRPRELQQLAAERHSPLILLPHLHKLQLPAGCEAALEQCRPGLRELLRLTVAARARCA